MNILTLIWSQFWQVTMLIGLVALLHRWLQKKDPHLVSILWFVVILKCVTPPIIPSPTGLFSLAQVKILPEHPERVAEAPVGAIDASAQQLFIAIPTWVPLAAVSVWLLGAAGLSCVWLLRLRKLQSEFESEQRTEPPEHRITQVRKLLAETSDELGLRRKPKLTISHQGFGPAVMGVFQPRVILPSSLLESPIEEIEPIVAHEVLHLKRRDTWFGMLQMIVAIMWWFHPAVWWALRRSNDAIERSVDDQLIRLASFSRKDYAASLLRVLDLRCRLHPVVGLSGVCSKEVTATRIRDILSESAPAQVRQRRQVLFACGLCLALLPGAVLNIPSQWLCLNKRQVAPSQLYSIDATSLEADESL